MRSIPAKDAKHGRPVVVVMSVEEYERLKNSEDGSGRKGNKSKTADQTGVDEN